MDNQYEAFCVADPLFYDSPATPGANRRDFSVADRPLPDGWTRRPRAEWLVFAPEKPGLPAQGWKVHVSACLDNAERLLGTVYDYCMAHGLEFKVLRSPRALLMRNAKYAPRGHSGKLVTIYPPGEDTLVRTLVELGRLLDGEAGPYILSDLRWGSGPLYVRYGGFAERLCVSQHGRLVPALADPSGKLVPDTRGPVFTLPPWVMLPPFLEPHRAARQAATVADLPYQIEKVLHFSNGGGLYVGRDKRTGQRVVLKEARPHAGVDGAGGDAVTRQRREHRMLQRLAGMPGVPRVLDQFRLAEHEFLVLEFIEGKPLNKCQVERYPLIRTDPGPEAIAGYTEWALRVYREVEAVVQAINAQGVVYGDLHMFNVMVRPDDTVVLLDYEVAATVGEGLRPGIGSQAFRAPDGRAGLDIDRYALACLRLALFLPLTALLRLHLGKARQLAGVIADHFPVPAGFLAEAVEVIAARPAPPPPAGRLRRAEAGPPAAEFDATRDSWPLVRRRLAEAILASASPDRDDRLFPGDVQQFITAGGGLGLAHGAAGVLYALSVTGCARADQLEEWLVARAADPPDRTTIGLFDGLHGVAFALHHLGHRQLALDLLDACLKEDWTSFGLDLMGGIAGMGLNLAHFAQVTGEPGLWEAALRAADIVADRLGDEAVATTSGGDHPYAGLTHGSSGPALLFLRMHDATGDASFLDRAATALRQDLRRCVVREDGQLEVNEGWRTMPYLARGSVGIGLALDEYLARRADGRFATASRQIVQATRPLLYAQSGLFAGRAGIILYLARRPAADRARAEVDALAGNVRRLGWHALPYAGSVAFPGDQLLRLSMDLATGTAGVLLALGAALHDEPVGLPLLPATARRQPT